MPVTKTLMAVGSWSLTLLPNTPRNLIDALSYYGHIVVSTGRPDPRVAGNSLFTSGRFTGVITGLDFQSLKQKRGAVVSGDGLETWLGTPKGVGPVIENIASFTSAASSTVFNTLRPTSVGAGTNFSIASSGLYTGAFVWKTPRDALTSFCQQVSTGSDAAHTVEWRVNNNCTLDTGPVASLYVTSPVTAIVAKNEGVDMRLRGLAGVAELIEDVKDYTTRVVVLASGSGAATAVGTANIADVGGTNPYKDFFGNPVQMTRMVSASSVSSFNATASAQSALIPYTTPRDQVKLTSSEYDIMGVLNVGDYTYVYDPDAGLVDSTNELVFRGQRINPTKQRVIELTWPIVQGMSVAYRDLNGKWYDLTDYIQWETGDTTVVVGGFNRSLVPTSEPAGPRPIPDTTIPGVPTFGAFSTNTYLSSSDGSVKAQIQLTWTQPNNTDGTTMTDLDHYEIQYRPDLTISSVNPTWTGLNSGGYTWAQLNSTGAQWSQIFPITQTNWKVTFVAGGVTQLLIQELTPGVTYDFQIRAVDTAQPPNRSAWSGTTTFQAASDSQPPPTPDAPTVAANMASVQISWDCGRADGGTFNQASDLHHIEVHGSYEPLFVPTNSTKLGNLPASIANITGQIPVVGSFVIPPGQPPAQAMYIKVIAVDSTGNKSSPSVAAGATAVLWSNAYITDLNVSKLTAGTLTASVVVGGVIGTALSGQRATMDSTGFHAYDASGSKIFDVSSVSPLLTLGRNGASGASITMDTSQANPVITMSDGVNVPGNISFAGNATYGSVGMEINSGSFFAESPISAVGIMQLAVVGDGGTTALQYIDRDSRQPISLFELKSDQARMLNTDLLGNVLSAYRVGEDGHHYGTGFYYNNFLLSGSDVFGAGEAAVSGFSSATVSFGVTMATFTAEITNVRDVTGGTTTQGSYVSGSGGTSFSAAWHTTTPTHFWYWLIRLDA